MEINKEENKNKESVERPLLHRRGFFRDNLNYSCSFFFLFQDLGLLEAIPNTPLVNYQILAWPHHTDRNCGLDFIALHDGTGSPHIPPQNPATAAAYGEPLPP